MVFGAFLLDHGAIDMIVARSDIRSTIGRLCRKMQHQVEPDTTFADVVEEEAVVA